MASPCARGGGDPAGCSDPSACGGVLRTDGPGLVSPGRLREGVEHRLQRPQGIGRQAGDLLGHGGGEGGGWHFRAACTGIPHFIPQR